jgi:hypothetical protein
LRLKCLETLLQLLQLIQADATGTAALIRAAAPQQQQLQQAESNGSKGGGLVAAISTCLAGVSANDPSIAHKALAAKAAAVMEQLG